MTGHVGLTGHFIQFRYVMFVGLIFGSIVITRTIVKVMIFTTVSTIMFTRPLPPPSSSTLIVTYDCVMMSTSASPRLTLNPVPVTVLVDRMMT